MTSSEIKLSAQQPAGSGVDWRLFGILMSAALMSSLAVVPYLIVIIRATGKQVVAWRPGCRSLLRSHPA